MYPYDFARVFHQKTNQVLVLVEFSIGFFLPAPGRCLPERHDLEIAALQNGPKN